ncbi:Aminoacyl-tRNA synthetase, class 1a, anticodon-binding [Pseudocohnilembus persalinus]|uniref:cysteine--tRNA ligase n=1 Tax=Pseudocohnilembus persalinus TaxID=266149 RepID=A0A0V0QNW9_PSEPJ|nr:Aminoacyl-tRNA synthetase, class 1a, anticodon-binding [Pseudocohnilembus persalinus]|eukprot:KRX03970.1 Aminoacyl-tRNA synthetase, class 1a, anticodon-binding [Pseudocohnilembus persalinus]
MILNLKKINQKIFFNILIKNKQSINYFYSNQLTKKQFNMEQYLTGLKVKNSFKPNELEELKPQKGRQLKIYNCGPTVYDASHMGHARTYVTVDMIRRILEKYFNYDIFFAMNITDIDDKIIQRSNEQGANFSEFARKWELDYWEDMKALGIDYPDVLVRVSEHMPEIIDFIQKIIDNGYAYESNGSVYFSVPKFQESPNHQYAKLDPLKAKDPKEQEEENKDKRDSRDFALWKASKPDEPKWKSQWSEGRPGWHIECSAMANYVLGFPIDIHMGGIDLKFPHHDNELAQTEAYYNKQSKEENQWINYFIHAGHLNINGLKMSKSLKNFITIKNLLKHFTSRQLRLLFIMHQYNSVMDYAPHTEDEKGNLLELNSMQEPVTRDQYYTNFFRTIIAIQRQGSIGNNQKWNKKEFSLNQILMDAKQNIHAHFLNNFNTLGVIKEIDQIIKETNLYLKEENVNMTLLNKVFNYVKFIFECIGLDFEDRNVSNQKKDLFLKEIDLIAKFRDQAREFSQAKEFEKIQELAEKNKDTAQNCKSEVAKLFQDFIQNILSSLSDKNPKKLFEIFDKIRDEDLPQFGIKLEDRNGEPSLWIEEDKDVLLKEIEAKKQLKLKQQAEKEKKEKEKLLKQQQELEQMKINPKEMFLKNPEYTQFNEHGIPTHDKEGKELNKKNQKYVQKLYDQQAKKYEQYLKMQEQQQKKE